MEDTTISFDTFVTAVGGFLGTCILTVLFAFILAYYISLKVCRSGSRRRSSARGSRLNASSGKRCEVIAHKGAAVDGPENTLGAIHRAAENGADGLEIDIQLTKDKRTVLLHDSTLNRTTDGTGNVTDYTYEELSKLNAASKFQGEWNEFEKIPLLSEAVEIALGHNLFIFFDIKDTSRDTLDQIVGLFKKHPELYDRSIVSSFEFSFLYKVKRIDSKIGVVPIYDGFSKEPLQGYTGAGLAMKAVANLFEATYLYILFYYINPLLLDFDIVSVNFKLVDDRFIAWWADWGKEVVVWTVNCHEVKFEFLHKKVSVITDIIPSSNRASLT